MMTQSKKTLKILVYTDGRPEAAKALHFGAELKKRLASEMAVITVRPGTHATEDPTPVGVDFPLDNRNALSVGLQRLVGAVDVLTGEGLLEPQLSINVRAGAQGHLFICTTPSGERIPFYERFGHFMETLNHVVEDHNYDLLIVAPPRRRVMWRFFFGDTTRKLALDLHTSILVVRGGNPNSRFLVCADGSPAARRQFPLLKNLLPAITGPLELIWAKLPSAGEEKIRTAEECLQHAANWLENCDKYNIIRTLEGDNPTDLILGAAGNDAVLMMGASLRHDVYKRMRGSLPIKILSRTESSMILVKRPPDADTDFFKDPFTC
ncbi:MAG: universal stress protein [Desulfobacterales bacterium]|jgi:nucleotide-binding universal stress UspA family protein